MQLINILAALTASAALVAAGPVKARDATWGDCPNGWAYCGECNGTSCNIAGTNHGCNAGTSCSAQSGGGDGKICGGDDPFYPTCPGKV